MDAVLASLQIVFSLGGLASILFGVAAGIFVGAMPGLGPSMGVALLVPLTFSMTPEVGVILLVSLYLAAEYGGSISAILIGTPGTAAATATVVDGYPLCRAGYPGKALTASLTASTIGGIIGALALIIAAQPIARFALSFGPVEYCSLGILGLAIISSLSGDNLIKGLGAASLGLVLTLVGVDPVTGVTRFTFGFYELFEGIPFLTALIGLFAVAEVFSMVEQELLAGQKAHFSSEGLTRKELLHILPTSLRGSIIGTVVGAVPGAGGSIACWLAYDQEKRLSSKKTERPFGEGALRGVAAPESSNNATVGGALIPLLTLGMPGSPTTAVLVGALMIHGLQPGPKLFVENQTVVYSLFIGLIFANVVMYLMGRLGMRLWVKIVAIPQAVLAATILALSMIAAYSLRTLTFDIWLTLGFGVIGFIMKKSHFPLAPMILAMILGPMVESNYNRALLMAQADGHLIFLESPLSVLLLSVAVLAFAYSTYKGLRPKKSVGQ